MTQEQLKYPWKRFWCPGGVSFTGDGAYLFDPDSEHGNVVNPDVVAFPQIAHLPCLILLGDPGIGKSTTVTTEREALVAEIERSGDSVLAIDLREYGDESRLIRDCFDAQAFRSWQSGDNTLHLFYDSLDECRLEIPTIANLLSAEMRKCKPYINRLRVRIACRTGEWPSSLEKALHQLWGDDFVGAYELLPLRRCDVTSAVKAESLDSDRFFAEVADKQAEAFASNPTTLKFLITTFRSSGCLPTTRVELFDQGCQLLCPEVSETRRDAGYHGTLSPGRRFSVACRIAAAMVFCGKSSIFLDVPDGDLRSEDITLGELEGGTESNRGDTFGVGEAELREVLTTTPLFSGRGISRLGFAHQSYAEFLAARYVVMHQLDLVQTFSLIRHPEDPSGKVVPQLSETAAWLASMDNEVFQAIRRSDPQVLLRSDVSKADDKNKAELVDSLLTLSDREELDDSNWDLRWHYGKLKHKRLATQLTPFITDRTKNRTVRRLAIDVAEACKETEIQELLADTALDSSEDPHIRVQAAYAVAAIAEDAVKLRLKPLALGEGGDDPDDDLRGIAMGALWPQFVSAGDLFASVIPPKQESYGGAYSSFFTHKLIPGLAPADLPVALDWCARQDFHVSGSCRLSFLLRDITNYACANLSQPGVVDALARYIISRIERRHPLRDNDDAWKLGAGQRRALLLAVVPSLPNFDDNASRLLFGESRLIETEDIDWLIQQAVAAPAEPKRWARLVGKVAHCMSPSQFEAAILATRVCPALAEEFSWLSASVKIDSPEAEAMRTYYERELEMSRLLEERRRPPLLDPPPKDRVEHWLAQCESGNPDAWWILNREMQLEPTSTHYLYNLDLASDLAQLPGWTAADDVCRARMVQAAKLYILNRTSASDEWITTGAIHFPDFAGYRALSLLLTKAPGFLDQLSPERWANWAPVVLGFSVVPGTGEGQDEIQHELIRRGYAHAPDIVIATLMKIIKHEDDKTGYLFVLRRVELCWDERLSLALLVTAKEGSLKPECLGDLLAKLMEHQCPGAQACAEALVGFPPPVEDLSRRRAVEAATALWSCALDRGWSRLWPTFNADPGFGKEVMAKVTNEDRHQARSIRNLTENQLAELFIWLSKQYPQSEDPDIRGFHCVGSRESVADFRDDLLRNLQARATARACEAIQAIKVALPNLSWLNWTLRAAKQATLRATWRPLRPGQLFELTRDPRTRLVQSGAELLAVVIESIEALQKDLQAETPAVRDIWDRQGPDGRWRPVDENDLSDYAARHLRKDLMSRGIIALREVEIRRGRGGTPGEETDIHITGVVEGLSRGSYDSVRVIVETKGCWNAGLKTAMKEQLVDRYLKDNDCQHGLYLVGWFRCAQWDSDDPRFAKKPGWNLDEARERLGEQAKELSTAGIAIRSLVLNCAFR